ncbi:RagB/SusD family nutrient uptake outer membrane protein [Chitinophaga nivalis]|uniref:RagB/SusD family nutrient uptake outer membrane protein n=1 Tax=Chitinophaga nivalis TaxID=2991709 RepID=A0ABT3IGF0_9BACT|nr:RagB/SusD family nutrient uptake outer membrane protein [Chitinophaga nivalis]MCW3467317.1 RagB/SusD family nutrient uptake outer membrane protein [Chitinophaga nivalis]MCW3482991.1 RagB/SusD family nutrient uptake outer membrane protein [Chitinophaga nivalis]
MKPLYAFHLILITTAGLLTACSKQLDLKPNNAISGTEAIIDAGTARAAVYGAYDAVQDYQRSNYPVLGFLTGDNVDFNGTLSQYLQADQVAITSENPIISEAYRDIYKAINSANNIIAAVPGVQDPQLAQAEKNQILGDAYFIRALGYFDLGRGWSGVQLQLKPTTDLQSLKGIKRSTLNQTYDQVLADLITAEQLLPDNNVRNRAGKNTVRALRARLHLYREQWTEAATYASLLIGNKNYELVKPYQSFSTAPFLSKESILELTFSSSDANNNYSDWYPSSLGGSFTLRPSASFVTKVNDPAIGGARKSLVATTTIAGNTVTYGNLYNRDKDRDDPVYIIRIAELYLIRAEARAHLNQIPEAREDLNAVRERADLSPVTITGRDALLLAIENENSIEFAFEGHRWFDLVRTKRAGTVLGVTDTRKWVFPIPFADEKSDPDVQQNEGY